MTPTPPSSSPSGAAGPPHTDGSDLPLAVAVIIRNAKGELLLIQRAHHLPLGGYWTPITGRLEPGESLEDAAHREVAEETGLTIALGRELTRGVTSNRAFRLVYFLAEHTGGALAPDPREVATATWLAPDDALTPEPMLPTTRAILGLALQVA